LSIDKMSVVLLMAHILKLCNTVTRTFWDEWNQQQYHV
jgi:hypothetical protein